MLDGPAKPPARSERYGYYLQRADKAGTAEEARMDGREVELVEFEREGAI